MGSRAARDRRTLPAMKDTGATLGRRRMLRDGLTVLALAAGGGPAAWAQDGAPPVPPALEPEPLPASGLAMPPALKVSANRRFLVQADGAPFFWLGDTAWRLHALWPAEVRAYLDHRRAHGFNVIQGPVLTLDVSNYAGERNDDPQAPNPRFFAHIDRIVDEAGARGLYIAPVVIWGESPWTLRTARIAHAYGRWLGARYRGRSHVVWIVAGEYGIRSTSDETNALWDALGAGLRQGGEGRHLVTIHPSWTPEELQTSSTFFHHAPWLAFNMIQSSQGGNGGTGAQSWRLVAHDYARRPPKPTLDAEATYEYEKWDDFGIRRRAYWGVFAGGCGHTYGAEGVMDARAEWRGWLDVPGGLQMKHLRALMESRPLLTRIPDQGLVAGDPGGVPDRIQATRDARGAYAMLYIPRAAAPVEVNARGLRGGRLRAWWFNPRDGTARAIGTLARRDRLSFTTPAGPDWVLVLDDAARDFPAPGAKSASRSA